MAPGDRVSWNAKAVQLSRSSNLSSLDYQNATRAQWAGDRGIIKIVLGFRPTFIAGVVDWTELAMLITIEIAKESGQEGEGDHD
jgi:hypothetical protein